MEQNKIYDSYSEKTYTIIQVHYFLNKYLLWCKKHKQKPEVRTIDFINEDNIGHVVYHAELLDNNH